jgi:hypothetical protein
LATKIISFIINDIATKKNIAAINKQLKSNGTYKKLISSILKHKNKFKKLFEKIKKDANKK